MTENIISSVTASDHNTKKILILYAHPAPSNSQVNACLFKTAQCISGVTMVDLYAEYPRFDIDVHKERKRLDAHDILIFQYPLYWYSSPALLKQWQDSVLGAGYAYGGTAQALSGKICFSAITAGGPEAAYRPDLYGHFSLRDLLLPLEQMAILCGMDWLPPFSLFSADRALAEGRLASHLKDWQALLVALQQDRLELTQLRKAARLNAAADAFLKPLASPREANQESAA